VIEGTKVRQIIEDYEKENDLKSRLAHTKKSNTDKPETSSSDEDDTQDNKDDA
jgi:hypothetical protein